MYTTVGFTVGIVTQSLFLYTVWNLFRFLWSGGDAPAVPASWPVFFHDLMLAGQFAALHSLLLFPVVRARLSRLIPRLFYGTFYCLVTCVSLLVIFQCWQPMDVTCWNLQGGPAWLMRGLFLLTWGALIYSLNLNGLGYQTGLTDWLVWLRGVAPPRRAFQPRGAYRLFRHPVYLSFLGLIWFTPQMTLDHLALTGVWTVYIFLGSILKDERMAHFLGDVYREYQTRVPGYPIIPFGLLGKRRQSAPLSAVHHSVGDSTTST